MKKVIKFDTGLFESGKYEVETRDGRKAVILDLSCKSYDREDIVAKILSGNGESENIMRYYQDGRLISDSTSGPRGKDLVLVYEEEEKEKLPFSQYRPALESGEITAVTEFGEPVEIVKWDCKGKYPILAVIDDGDTHDSSFYDQYGVSMSGSKLMIRKKMDQFTESLAEVIKEARKKEDWQENLEANSEMLYNLVKKSYIQELKDKGKDGIIFKRDEPDEPETLENNGRPEIIDHNVPLTEEEFRVKKEILQAIKNGKLSHIEIKALTSYLRKILGKPQPEPLKWKRASQDTNYADLYSILVFRENIFGKKRPVFTKRLKKGELYFELFRVEVEHNEDSRN